MNEFVGKKVDVYVWEQVDANTEKKVTKRGIVVSQQGVGRQSLLKVKLNDGGVLSVSGWLVSVIE